MDDLDIKIADICAEKNVKIIQDHYSQVTDSSRAFNVPKMWGLRKKLNLQSKDVPTAKKDNACNMITINEELLALYKNTYMDRLAHKPISPEYQELKQLKENLFKVRCQISKVTKSEDWESEDIDKVCKSLKNSKARDECGFIY